MALKTPIFLENDTTTQNADELRLERNYLTMQRGGVYSLGSLAVTQRGAGANMSVDVAAGAAAVVGTENALQGAYHVTNDATVNLVVSAADATNPRKDLVIVNVRDSFYSGANNDGQLQVVAGTPAASPAEPNLVALGYKNYLVLAMIDVPALDTAITDSQITNRRIMATAAGGTVVCTSATRPASPWAGLRIYETDTKLEYTSDGTNWLLMAPALPHSTIVRVTGAAGTTSSTTYADLPTALSMSNFVKYRGDTKLAVTVAGNLWCDDAVVNVYVGVDIGGTDTDIVRIDTIGASTAFSFCNTNHITGISAGTIATIKAQWKVSTGTVVATMNGFWSLEVTETF